MIRQHVRLVIGAYCAVGLFQLGGQNLLDLSPTTGSAPGPGGRLYVLQCLTSTKLGRFPGPNWPQVPAWRRYRQGRAKKT